LILSGFLFFRCSHPTSSAPQISFLPSTIGVSILVSVSSRLFVLFLFTVSPYPRSLTLLLPQPGSASRRCFWLRNSSDCCSSFPLSFDFPPRRPFLPKISFLPSKREGFERYNLNPRSKRTNCPFPGLLSLSLPPSTSSYFRPIPYNCPIGVQKLIQPPHLLWSVHPTQWSLLEVVPLLLKHRPIFFLRFMFRLSLDQRIRG